jgi:hypothetical protein
MCLSYKRSHPVYGEDLRQNTPFSSTPLRVLLPKLERGDDEEDVGG